MVGDNQPEIEARVVRAAEAALAERRSVTAVDVLVGVGWLSPSAVDRWRQGRVGYLEQEVQVDPSRVATALALFRRWAEQRHLAPREAVPVTRTRDRRPLQFSAGGEPGVEQAVHTLWLPSDLPDAKRTALADRASRPPDLVVVQARRDWACTECTGGDELLIMEGSGPLCMACADLDHLVYLPAGNAALTRRARKFAGLSAVVVRFSRARGRYERQGVLVEEEALARAERECLADAEARLLRRQRDAGRRAAHDAALAAAIAREITRLFPGCPPRRAEAIARHTATRGSGRVGRSAAGRALDREAVVLAVQAAVRHADTAYDDLLMAGSSRADARRRVHGDMQRILDGWRSTARP